MRRTSLIFLVAVLFWGSTAFSLAQTQGGATLFLVPKSGLYSIGDSISVEVKVDTGGEQIVAVGAYLAFDGSRLQFVSVDVNGSAFQFSKPADVSRNLIRIDRAEPTPGVKSSNAFVARVNFKATAPGEARIDFSLTDPPAESKTIVDDGRGTNVLKGATHATFTIGSEEKKSVFEPLFVPLRNMTTAVRGLFSRKIEGDVNSDGMVDIFDAAAVALRIGEQGKNLEGDVDHNGEVDIFDLVIVTRNWGKK